MGYSNFSPIVCHLLYTGLGNKLMLIIYKVYLPMSWQLMTHNCMNYSGPLKVAHFEIMISIYKTTTCSVVQHIITCIQTVQILWYKITTILYNIYTWYLNGIWMLVKKKHRERASYFYWTKHHKPFYSIRIIIRLNNCLIQSIKKNEKIIYCYRVLQLPLYKCYLTVLTVVFAAEWQWLYSNRLYTPSAIYCILSPLQINEALNRSWSSLLW